MKKSILALTCIACLAGVLVVAPLTSQAAAPTAKEISELVAREKFIKEQFEQLKSKMLELADLFEKTAAQPDVPDTEKERQAESARILRQAVAQAQSAAIAQKMDSVANLLDKDKAIEALRAKDQVIKELRKVLDTLISGLSIDNRDRLKALLAKVGEMIKDQEKLEKESRAAKDREANAKTMAELGKRLADVIKEQKDLLAKAGQLSKADPSVAKLDALRQTVRELIAQQTRIQSATPMTPVAKLSVPAQAQENLAGKTTEAQKTAGDAQKDADLAKALFKAGADEKTAENAAKALGLASNEMQKASKALKRSSKASAAKPQEPALLTAA